MELNAYYSKQVRRSLGYFPVWEPGENVSPGDVGELVNGVFEKRTSIRRILGLTPKIARQNLGNPTRFYSQGCTVGKIRLDASASHDPNSKARGSVMLQFSGEGGVVFDATDALADGFEDLEALCQEINGNKVKWTSGYVFVGFLESSPRFRVLISTEKNASLELHGNVDALNTLAIASSDLSFTGVRSQWYERKGLETDGKRLHPLLMRLYGFRWRHLGSMSRLLEIAEDHANAEQDREIDVGEISVWDTSLP